MVIVRKTKENLMYYGASDLIIRRAKELRKKQTSSEIKIWKILGAKKMCGLSFRRQHPINRYIADFYCHSIKLVIEIDGNVHDLSEKKESDTNRTAELHRFGIVIIRFRNDQINDSLEEIKKSLENTCNELILLQKNEIN
jgi:very-short-patch-repair endonuclease